MFDLGRFSSGFTNWYRGLGGTAIYFGRRGTGGYKHWETTA
jgi:hypothetical protein